MDGMQFARHVNGLETILMLQSEVLDKGYQSSATGVSSTSDWRSHHFIYGCRIHINEIIDNFLRKNNYPLNSRQLHLLAAHLEEELFKEAASQDEYMNLKTLGVRLQTLLQRNAEEAANQFFPSVPMHQVGPDAYCLPLSSSKDHTVDSSYYNGHWSLVGGAVGCHLFAGQGTFADPYSKGQLSASSFKKQQLGAFASSPFIPPEGTPCGPRVWNKNLHPGANRRVKLPPRNPHDSYGASSQGHGLTQKNMQWHNLPPSSGVQQNGISLAKTIPNIPLELPSNQSYHPLNSAASKVSSTAFGLGTEFLAGQGHIEENQLFLQKQLPSGVQRDSWQVRRSRPDSLVGCNWSTSGDAEVALPACKRLKRDDQLGSSSKSEIPLGKGLSKWQTCPESLVSIDSQSAEPVSMVAMDNGPYSDIDGVLNSLVEDSSARNHGNCVSPLEEIFGLLDNEVDMDNNRVKSVADSCAGSGSIFIPSEESPLGCEDGAQVMERASELNLVTVYSTSAELTVVPNNLMKQDLATDEALVDSSGMRPDSVEPNLCLEEERQVIGPTDKGSEREHVLSEAIYKEVSEAPVSGGIKATGVSLIEYFTREQIEDHLSGLKESSCQIIPHDREMDAAHKPLESPCTLCLQNVLSFAPATIDCSSCYKIIKVGSDYYTPDNCEKLCFCSLRCGRKSKDVQGEAKLVKRKHDERMEEPWVQCDRCGAWQHQICALYNKKRDLAEKAEYICPSCCLKVIHGDDRMTFSKGRIFGAKDLPCTKLSDHIEKRLYDRLKQEREDRAKASGKNFYEVTGAEDLVVRVLSSLSKKIEVNKLFPDILGRENYPSEFPYKSKVIALFQKIGGVDVFLFGMYVQEYGSECSQPNKRCVYISYLDSVKYFLPDIKSAYEVSLRTFVYHEILIGYLEYCKKRGFVSCYLWACPPVKGDDYLFYCHPEFQKNLPRKMLLKWYRKMFGRATDEKIVLSCTNFFECYLAPSRGDKFNVTAAQLPYFEGDHWTSKLDKFLEQINQRPVEELVSKRALKGCENWKDNLLMQKIEQSMPDKDDFIVAHLQYRCTCCREAILSGKRWFCNHCKNFQLCQRCVECEAVCGASKKPPVCREHHLLSQATVDYIAEETEDEDITIENQLFENRQTFLYFCKQNENNGQNENSEQNKTKYQFDTLRRAKYSSMMILHHLHEGRNQIAGTACSLCQEEEMVDPCRTCTICPDFRVCKACYTRDDFSHCHELTPACSDTDETVLEVQLNSLCQETIYILDILVHSSRCAPSEGQPCSYPYCSIIKGMFHHTTQCSLGGLSAGCKYCLNVRKILNCHAAGCVATDCQVPRCREIKDRLKLKQDLLIKEKKLEPDKGIKKRLVPM